MRKVTEATVTCDRCNRSEIVTDLQTHVHGWWNDVTLVGQTSRVGWFTLPTIKDLCNDCYIEIEKEVTKIWTKSS